MVFSSFAVSSPGVALCVSVREPTCVRASNLHDVKAHPPPKHNTHKALTPTPTHNPLFTQTSAMASSSSMLLRGLGQGASKHSFLSSTVRRSPSVLQTRSIYADATGKTYERQGLVMTRIVCTIGPASEPQDVMQALADEGMKIGRLNFSHAVKYEDMTEKLQTFRGIKGAHRRVGIDFNLRGALLDTKGPEIRTGSFEGGAKHVEIPSGAEVILTTDPAWKDKGTAEKVYVDYGALGRTCKKGGNILLDDGIIKLEVIEPLHRVFHTDDPTKPITETLCVVKNRNPVTLGARKGTNIPGAILELPALTERDKRDLEWGVDNDVDFVAASFVRKAADVRSVIVHLERLMAKQKPTAANPRLVRPVVISKIENAEAIANFDEILAESDGIMVARGDLGVEVPFQDVFTAQKMMVKKCNDAGKPVIVATQMLDSMMRNPRPTRAEVSDVGNAVLDGADCVMLSGETAAGKYPVESVQAMRNCVVRADTTLDHPDVITDPLSVLKRARGFTSRVRTSRPGLTSEELETVALCTVVAASELRADLIIVLTTRGNFARAVAKHRPQIPVMVFCSELKVARQLQLFRGLFPVLPPNLQGATVEDIPEAIRTAKEIGWVKAGDKVVVSNYELWEDAGIKQSMNLRVFPVQ